MNIKDIKTLETDALVMGGGIGGCYAAAKMATEGMNVIVAEKSHTRRSGSGAMGEDHYEPVKNDGITNIEFIKLWEERQHDLLGPGRFVDRNVVWQYIDKSMWVCDESEKFDITMRWDDGEFRFMPQAWFGGPRLMLRVHWQDIKPRLSKAVKKAGAKVLERVMLVDLLTDAGRVVGATAVNTRTGEFMVIKAKAVIIATGIFARCWEPEEPLFYRYQMKYHWNPASISGDGYAVAYRAGAELANMDLTGWGLRIRDDLTISYGNFDHGDGIRAKWYTADGEEIPYPTADKYREIELAGKDPIYVTQDHLHGDYHKRMQTAFVDEKMISFKIAQDRKFNPKTHRYELMENHPLNFMVPTGINIDDNFKSVNMDGLYAVGDCSAGAHGCGNAAAGGLLVSDHLRDTLSQMDQGLIDEDQVAKHYNDFFMHMKPDRKSHKPLAKPMELELSTRYIAGRYVGQAKNGGRLKEGKRRLETLKREFIPMMVAEEPHFLMRAQEAKNIMDLTAVHIDACLERKESRGQFLRLDYPDRDPARDDIVTYQRMENGEPVMDLREPPDLKPEYGEVK